MERPKIEDFKNKYMTYNVLNAYSKAQDDYIDFVDKRLEAINFTDSSQLLNACLEIGDKVIYDGEKAEIVFIDKNTDLLNLEYTFDQTMIYGINRKYCTKSV